MNSQTLGNLFDYLQPGPYIVSSEKYDDSFMTPVLTAGKSFILGKTNEIEGIYYASKKNPIILFDDFTTDIKWVDFPFKVKSSACKILVGKQDVNRKYGYYAMSHIKFDVFSHQRFWISNFSHISINYPDAAKQCEITAELDNISLGIEQKKAELSLLDSLVKSRFNEQEALS
jgi:type I restriction enzyme S subunit